MHVVRPRTRSRARLAVDGLQAMDGFVSVNEEECEQMRRLFATNVLLQTAFHFTVSGLLSGGVVIEHKVVPRRNDNDRAWYSENWGRFTSDLIYAFWLYGFAVVMSEPDPRYISVPRVVPMELVHVEVRYDLYGSRTYRVSAQARPGSFAGASGDMSQWVLGAPGSRVLRDVMVYEFDAPDMHGHLRSRTSVLLGELALTERITDLYLRTCAKRADIPLVLEAMSDSYDQKNIRPAETQPGLGMLNPVPSVMNEYEYLAERRVVDAARLMNAGLTPDMQLASEVKTATTRQGHTVVQLPRDRRLVSQLLPEAPKEILDMRHELVLRVGALFQVPLASLFGANKLAHRVSNSTEVDVSMELFSQQQRELKQTLVPILKDVFVEAYLRQLVALSVAQAARLKEAEKAEEDATADSWSETETGSSEKETPKKKRGAKYEAADPEAVSNEVERALEDLVVLLPGLPPIQETMKLYAMGLLKYGALKTYVSTVYGIPDSHLHDEPQLELEDSGAVVLDVPAQKEEPPEAGPAKKKSKKKS